MTRKKVQLAYITNDSARKATYKKRKNGLLKKVHEISTLCGVDACVIIYSPYEAQPVLWPPSDNAVQQVLGKFRSMPEMDQSKKMVNQQTFLRERIGKIKDQLKKLIKDNREKEMSEVMFDCLLGKDMSYMTMMDFNDLVWLIDSFTKELTTESQKRIREGGKDVQTNIAGPDMTVDTKPPIVGINSSTGNPAIPPGRHSYANWFLPRGFMNTYDAVSSNNRPYLLPVVNTNTMLPPPPPPHFNMGGFVFNSGVGASSSNNPLSGLPGMQNITMMPQPPPRPVQFNMHGFVNNNDDVASSFNNMSGVPDEMMPPPPPPFNIDDVYGPNNPNFFGK